MADRALTKGTIGVLNVGAGDTKLVFDKNNPAECIRSGRIVTDMLRRGYALLIEVDDGKGGKVTTRVREFREDVGEYIVADFDPQIEAKVAGKTHAKDEQGGAVATGAKGTEEGVSLSPISVATKAARNIRGVRGVPATGASGIAVARSAGG